MQGSIREIRQAVLDNAELSKDDIRLTWDLSEDEYTQLKAALRNDVDIEPGPQRTGGFCVRKKRWHKQPEEVSTIEVPVDAWQRRGAERLAVLLTVPQLEELLGRKLSNALRLDRKRKTGRDSPNRLSELASAIIVKYDRDLLSAGGVRAAVAKACSVPALGKWHPGKTGAAEFVRSVGFPIEFAGLPAEDAPPSFEYLEGRLNLPKLLDFQEEVRNKMLGCLESPSDRAILTLPTGAGKTRVAVEAIRDWLTRRSRQGSPKGRHAVLWLAHSGELCEQAYECFRQVWHYSEDVCALLLFRFWGRYTHDFDHHQNALLDILEQPSVLVSTPNRVVNIIEGVSEVSQDVLQILLSTIRLVVIDEAHRAATPSYKSILNRLANPATSDTRVIGLTATPYRGEYLSDGEAGTKALSELFGRELIEPEDTLGQNARLTLQKRGVLSRFVEEFIDTATILEAPQVGGDELSEDDIEKIDHALRIRADNPTRRQTVFERIVKLCDDSGSSILYFGPSVADAECVAFLLRQAGIRAAFVGADTRDVSRRRIVSDFKHGRYKVLCNCEVLTTGFDAPKVTHVVVARPTVSGVLYEQMIGRGLRGPEFGGTEHCVIVNCRDSYRSTKPTLGYEAFRHLWEIESRR